ncbi:hypothetical protein ACFQ2B_35465 [Streptomyces stramineus]
MVPGEFVVLDRIPTNANGKPDRRALPAPKFLQDAPVTGQAPGARPSCGSRKPGSRPWAAGSPASTRTSSSSAAHR